MVEAEEVEALLAPGKAHDPGLVGMQLQPNWPRIAVTRRSASSAAARLRQSTTKSSAKRTSTPSLLLVRVHSASNTWSATLHSKGEIGEPCGVPAPVSVVTPSSNTPTRSHARSSRSIARSDTRLATKASKASCRIDPKQSRTSASSTQSAPRLASTRITSHAWRAERRGRNP